MKDVCLIFAIVVIGFSLLTAFSGQEEKVSLAGFAPEHHQYYEAESCASCKGDGKEVMQRVVGVEMAEGNDNTLDARGWLAGIHSKSQDHGERVNTACAWCHSPTTEGAIRDEKAGEPIPKGNWQGVTCAACHPKPGRTRVDLYGNLHPGKDLKKKDSYIFRDITNGKQGNELCTWCHHEYHDFQVEAKTALLKEGSLRCIDCHMAGYKKYGDGLVERFHNMKVASNTPHSCSGKLGTSQECHPGASQEWMSENMKNIKGPRKSW